MDFASGKSQPVNVTTGRTSTANVTMIRTPGIFFFQVSNAIDWAQACTDARGSSNYIIVIKNDINTHSFPQTFSTAGTVEIFGNGYTLTLGSDYTGALLNVENTVKIHDLKLQGHTSNTDSLVFINGGNLEMNGSSSISGNTSNGGYGGGGVRVNNNGTLTMRDSSSITGNTSLGNNGGGGVCLVVNSGSTLIMHNSSLISNNISNFSGGGVLILTGCTFNITGGTITNNTAGNDGHQLYNNGTATGPGGFQFNGGAVDDPIRY
jgi:hypothetical protein